MSAYDKFATQSKETIEITCFDTLYRRFFHLSVSAKYQLYVQIKPNPTFVAVQYSE